VLIEAHDEWQDSDRRYLSEESMALLNPPPPTAIQLPPTPTKRTPRAAIRATA
jgi:putative transposase